MAREPLAQEIRLTWWREALDEISAPGAVRRHPVVEALAVAVRRNGMPPEPLVGMIEARFEAIDAPPTDEPARLRHIDRTAGAVMRLAVQVLAPAEVDSPAIAPAARAWALARMGQPATAALAQARASARRLPAAAFPAIAYATLARAYRRGRGPSPLGRRIRLLGAVLTGKL